MERLKFADRAAVQLLLQRAKVRIEAAIERQEHARPRCLELRGVCFRAREVEIDRFFAEDRFARLGGAQAEIEVRIRGRGHDHARHFGVAKRAIEIGDLCPVAPGNLFCRGFDRIDYISELKLRMRGNVRRMDAADAAGADKSNLVHVC